MSRYSPTVRIANRRPGGLWWRMPVALLLWFLMAAPLLTAGAGIWVLRQLSADLPAAPDLDRWDDTVPRTSVIVARDGTILAELPFHQGVEVGHRFPVAFGDIPRTMVHAVLAAEDARFFAHQGVDFVAVVRAALSNWRAGRIVEGASTITQQVARNLLPEKLGRERTFRRKVREALLSRRIEARHSKQRIFEVYVNHVFLGANAYGIAAAARAYFGKTLGELDLAQTALIAGLAQAPGRADPYRDMDAARARRDEVLVRMARAGFITEAEAEAARGRGIELLPPVERYGSLAPWHTEQARREVAGLMPRAFARGGLRIETTAEPALAMAAEAEARSWSAALGKDRENGPPEVAALVWDYRTGYMEVLVGGLSWQRSQFDRVSQACRQPGSAFKPVVYGAALEADVITPGTPLRDAPIAEYDEALNEHWKPRNTGRAFRGVVLAQDALALSLNAPAVDVLDRVGSLRVIDLARRLGITTDLADVRPMALGASCVIPRELAGAFAAIARGGTRVEPVVVTRIVRGGADLPQVLVDRASPYDPMLAPARRLDRMVAAAAARPERALDQESAFLLSAMLADVVQRGTATDARRLGRPLAGKTGTTNHNTDAWFVGFTGRVVAAVWIGHDDPARVLGHRDDGAHAALPLWMRLIALAEGDRAPVPVPGEPPSGLVRVSIDRETGFLARPGAGGALDLYLKRGTEPTERAGQLDHIPEDLSRATRRF